MSTQTETIQTDKSPREKQLLNDYGYYTIHTDGIVNECIGVVGLGEDEWPCAIIAALQMSIPAQQDCLAGILAQLPGCTVSMEDETDHHSDILVIDEAGNELLRLCWLNDD